MWQGSCTVCGLSSPVGTPWCDVVHGVWCQGFFCFPLHHDNTLTLSAWLGFGFSFFFFFTRKVGEAESEEAVYHMKLNVRPQDNRCPNSTESKLISWHFHEAGDFTKGGYPFRYPFLSHWSRIPKPPLPNSGVRLIQFPG